MAVASYTVQYNNGDDENDNVYLSPKGDGFSKENLMSIACEFFDSDTTWKSSIHPTGLSLFIEDENDKRYTMKTGNFIVTFTKDALEAA